MLLRRVLSSVSVCPQTAPSRSSICQRPICRPVENHLSWALPCSAHVAVSLMKLVLQHLPSRPSCNTKGHWSIKGLEGIGGPPASLLVLTSISLLQSTCLLRYYAAISSHECDRPHPCPACALSLHLRLAPQLQVASPGSQRLVPSIIAQALAAKRARRRHYSGRDCNYTAIVPRPCFRAVMLPVLSARQPHISLSPTAPSTTIGQAYPYTMSLILWWPPPSPPPPP